MGGPRKSAASDAYKTVEMNLEDDTAFASDTFARFAVGIDSIPGGSSTADDWNDKIIMSTGMDFWCAG